MEDGGGSDGSPQFYSGALLPRSQIEVNVTGTSVVEQCGLYPEVAGSIPVQLYISNNYQLVGNGCYKIKNLFES